MRSGQWHRHYQAVNSTNIHLAVATGVANTMQPARSFSPVPSIVVIKPRISPAGRPSHQNGYHRISLALEAASEPSSPAQSRKGLTLQLGCGLVKFIFLFPFPGLMSIIGQKKGQRPTNTYGKPA